MNSFVAIDILHYLESRGAHYEKKAVSSSGRIAWRRRIFWSDQKKITASDSEHLILFTCAIEAALMKSLLIYFEKKKACILCLGCKLS